MALKATIYKFDLSISDMDRDYYADHQLTVARHPSESSERMMLRILAFIFNAHEQLTFTKGLSDIDEPDLWQKNLHDGIERWIELGQPSEQRIKKGCNQADQMMIYSYDNGSFEQWWQKEQNKLNTRANLAIFTIEENKGMKLTQLLARQCNIQCTLSEGQAWLTLSDTTIEVSPRTIKSI